MDKKQKSIHRKNENEAQIYYSSLNVYFIEIEFFNCNSRMC